MPLTPKVKYTDLEVNIAYITADVKMVSVDQNYFTKKEVDLCTDLVKDETEEDGNYENDCPWDGSYWFNVTYTLPGVGEHPATAWLATGFEGTGIISMTAAADSDTYIGYCEFGLDVLVTRSKNGSFRVPSAATGIWLAVGSALICFISCFCGRRACMKEKKIKVTEKSDGSDNHFIKLHDAQEDKGEA
jgi:hypothetical protein